MSSDHPLSKQTGLVREPTEWEWSSFRHDSLREAGMVEIESEWTAHDREMQASGGSARVFLGPEAALSLSKGQSTVRTCAPGNHFTTAHCGLQQFDSQTGVRA